MVDCIFIYVEYIYTIRYWRYDKVKDSNYRALCVKEEPCVRSSYASFCQQSNTVDRSRPHLICRFIFQLVADLKMVEKLPSQILQGDIFKHFVPKTQKHSV